MYDSNRFCIIIDDIKNGIFAIYQEFAIHGDVGINGKLFGLMFECLDCIIDDGDNFFGIFYRIIKHNAC